jgi:L-rhamnose isomerase
MEVNMKAYQSSDAAESAYALAKEVYAGFGINTDEVIRAALDIPVSIHCWQGDDVTGFEGAQGLSGGGIIATGNYPGKARNGDELRADSEFAFTLIPGKKRYNLHMLYAEPAGKPVSRDKLEPEHFKKWMDWSTKKKIPLDFNPSFFSHPLAEEATMSSADPKIRRFWIDHAIAARKIASAFGANQGSPSVNDIWLPDGSKDLPADRLGPRQRLKDALDESLDVALPAGTITDAVECKLFGIGSESYVVGSHEFYMGYAVQRQTCLCLDTGHFHPTETIADKISALALFVPGFLIHFSRGLRWDSDHVTTYSDDTREVCREIVRSGVLGKVNIALDYFDASINRIAAWVIGSRSLRKAFLEALLEPAKFLVEAEKAGKKHERLALLEEFKTLPVPAVWDKLCLEAGVPVGTDWLSQVDEYERDVLLKRE